MQEVPSLDEDIVDPIGDNDDFDWEDIDDFDEEDLDSSSDVEYSDGELTELKKTIKEKMKVIYERSLPLWDDDNDEGGDTVLLVGKEKYKINCSKSSLAPISTLNKQFLNVNENGGFQFSIDPSGNENIDKVDARTVLQYQWLYLNKIVFPFDQMAMEMQMDYRLTFVELLE